MNKHIYKTLTLGIFLALIGCTQRIKTNITQTSMKPLGDTDEVMVFGVDQPIPEGIKLIGKIQIDSETDTTWSYEQLISEAKKRARRAGGNVIKLTEIVNGIMIPFGGIYNRIKVDIYFHERMSEMAIAQNLFQDSITKFKFKGSPTFAILYVYRPGNMLGSALGYDIFLNDSIICRAKNNSKYEINVYKEGKMEIGVKRESRQIKTFDIKLGEEYFFKCEIVPYSKRDGTKPDFNLIDKSRGRIEYEAIKERD